MVVPSSDPPGGVLLILIDEALWALNGLSQLLLTLIDSSSVILRISSAAFVFLPGTLRSLRGIFSIRDHFDSSQLGRNTESIE